jgi:hypothetical protein
MASSQDTEITLGTAKLLGLFFGLVAVCAVFFALGYMLGRRSDAAVSAAAVGSALQSASSGVKPGSSATPAPPMTFYKAVEQKDASAQLTPASEDANPSATGGQGSESQATESESTRAMPAATSSDPLYRLPLLANKTTRMHWWMLSRRNSTLHLWPRTRPWTGCFACKSDRFRTLRRPNRCAPAWSMMATIRF